MAHLNCEMKITISNREGLDALAEAADLAALLAAIEAPEVKRIAQMMVGSLAIVSKSLKPRTREVSVEVTRVIPEIVDVKVGNLELKSGGGVHGFGFLKIDGVEVKEIRAIDLRWGVDEIATVRVEQLLTYKADGTPAQRPNETWRDKEAML